jgi:ATP-dependent Clp protease ATP-binding subunit ClpB
MQEALQSAQDIASEQSHQEITNEDFLLALLAQQDGVAMPLLQKLGVAIPALDARLREALSARSCGRCSTARRNRCGRSRMSL